MMTFSPTEYIPFKKRVKKAYIGLLGLVAFMVALFIPHIINKSPSIEQNTMSPAETIASILTFVVIPILFICGLTIFSQVWVLDEVIIDEGNKKIKIRVRKFDTVVDKGEYDIDDNLKIKIITKQGNRPTPINVIIFKYGKRRIYSQSNSSFAGAPNWPSYLFSNIKDQVEQIKQISTYYATTK